MSKIGNPLLERLVARELTAEILDALTPSELVVALLRAEGLCDREIGEFLGVGRWVEGQRMIRARRRILRTVPGAGRRPTSRRDGAEVPTGALPQLSPA